MSVIYTVFIEEVEIFNNSNFHSEQEVNLGVSEGKIFFEFYKKLSIIKCEINWTIFYIDNEINDDSNSHSEQEENLEIPKGRKF